MISVRYREKDTVDQKVFVVKRLTYSASQCEFALYDVDDNIIVFVSPVRLEATATINAPSEVKEE